MYTLLVTLCYSMVSFFFSFKQLHFLGCLQNWTKVFLWEKQALFYNTYTIHINLCFLKQDQTKTNTIPRGWNKVDSLIKCPQIWRRPSKFVKQGVQWPLKDLADFNLLYEILEKQIWVVKKGGKKDQDPKKKSCFGPKWLWNLLHFFNPWLYQLPNAEVISLKFEVPSKKYKILILNQKYL